ncbi:MAG: lipid-A-disaccharide synthase [Candidatus Margulisbacteria bacterium]|nr:lipid-A-disaccharide synthase [Candidatus Margulisiibacteriota bacterium]
MKIMISAGEVSGDVHGSYLVKELKKLRPDISFFGVGSDRLAAAGMEIRFDITKRGTIGLLEALPNLWPIFSTFLKIKKLIRREKPDLVILIDSQGLNLPLAKFCRKIGLKTVYYVAPQDWLWGTPAGVKRTAGAVGLIVAIFEKEFEAYKKAGANVVYFGHPLLDIVTSRAPRVAGQICLCPGSRTHELKTLFPILLEASGLIQTQLPDATFIIPAATQDIYNEIRSLINHSSLAISHYKVVEGKTYDTIATSDLALCASGTINLEASLLGVPNIMAYKLSRLTYFLGKYVLKIDKKIKYFSMPNILLDEKIIPEFIMSDAEPKTIAAAAVGILNDRDKQAQMKSAFTRLRRALGAPGAIHRAAQAILDFAG